MILPGALLAIALGSRMLPAAETIDSICVVVDDEIILESEVAYGINSLLLEQGIRTGISDEKLAEVRRQVIQSYVTQKILLARANEETLQVEDRVVNRELNRRFEALVQQAGSEERLVEYFGRPLPRIKNDLRKAVREGMLIDMVRRSLFGSVQVSREEVERFFTRNQAGLPERPASVELSHILLDVQPSEEAIQKARDKIESAMEALRLGADFDSLSALRSDDASAARGGRLGFTSRGDLVPEFEEVAYALEPGEISDVVESPFGYHIIRLIDRQGERISSQHILAKLAPTPEDWEDRRQQAEEIKRRIFEGGEDMGALAREFSSDRESRDKGGRLDRHQVADLPEEFRKALDGLKDGDLTAPFDTEFGVHLVRVERIYPERPISLKEDWQDIEQAALTARREETFVKWLQEQLDRHYIEPPLVVKSEE